MKEETALLIAFLTLSSGFLGALITAYFQRRRYTKGIKVDTLRRLAAYRYHLANRTVSATGEPFVALNEIFVVYSDETKVLKELKTFHDRLSTSPGAMTDDLLRLVKAMAKATKTELGVADNFITDPFVPPSVTP